MKKILCLISVLVMLVLSTAVVSAESVSEFELALVSESSTQVVMSLNFEGGASFSAIDFEVKINEKKLKVKSINEGTGFINFKLQATAISAANINKTPALVTAAMMPGYRNVNGNDLFIITLEKKSGESLVAGDVTINFVNCSDSNYNPLKVNVKSYLDSVVSTENSTVNSTVNSTNNSAGDETSSTVSQTGDSAETQIAESASSDNQELNAEKTTQAVENSENEKEKSKNTIIVVCVLTAVVVGASAGVTYIFMRKKNKGKIEEDNKENKEG